MSYPIHDLIIRSLHIERDSNGATLEVLRYSDHLLRRFGFAEVVFLESDQIRPAVVRKVADEVWALVEGSVQFKWLDLRTSSPTRDTTYQSDCDQPTLILVPFGVEFTVQAVGRPAQLLRLSTHEIDEE
jgi:dTDP-4-dehydrorhamnose 3,5-epimerase-like enzyme